MGTEERKRVIIFFSVIGAAFLFLLPTLFRSQFEDVNWISKPISLGLDLQGGVHLVYEVQADEAVQSRLQITANVIRSELRKAKVAVIRARATENNRIEVTLLSAKLLNRAKEIIDTGFKELSFVGQEEDSGRVTLIYGIPDTMARQIEMSAVSQSVETLRTRVDQFGVTEPLIQRAGERRIILQMPGASDIESVKKVVGSVARLEFRLVPNDATRRYQVMLEDREGNPSPVEDEVLMTGEAVDDARVSVTSGQVEVALSFTSEGSRLFRKITTENVNRQLAIVLDNVVYSAPNINEPIVGGRASITGGFDHEEARQLAVVLRAGALPAPLEVMEERTVGPTLGKESIQNGIVAIAVGFVLIIVFMVVYYRKSGIVAVGTLALNLFLIVAALSAFGATLTLPGIAGLALTIGMAVDANVIIFERIREELRNGSGRDSAVSAGFEHALRAIIDSNLTTLLAGFILYYFGTGPVRGFAVTLAIGILTTIYCATFVSRLAYDVFPLLGKNGKLSV